MDPRTFKKLAQASARWLLTLCLLLSAGLASGAAWTLRDSPDLACDPPAAPGLSSPADGSSTCDTTPTFCWVGIEGATAYYILVDNNSDFMSAEIKTDVSGSTTCYTPGTALAPGAYYWKVRVRTCMWGAYSAVWTLTIQAVPASAPVPSAPANGSLTCSTTPQFCWGAVSGATSYQLMVDNNSDFSSPEINRSQDATCYTPGTALARGAYYWQVRAGNACGWGAYSAVWSLTIGVPAAPVPSAPWNGSGGCNFTPQFCWGAVSGATSYVLQVDGDDDFSSPEFSQDVGNVTCFTLATALAADDYFWRVRGENGCGRAPWSAVWNFSVWAVPAAPVLSFPDNGGSTCEATPEFCWGALGNATAYELWVDNNSDFSSPEIGENVGSATCYTPATALASGAYYWKARAYDACGWGDWSPVWSLTILPASSCPTATPTHTPQGGPHPPATRTPTTVATATATATPPAGPPGDTPTVTATPTASLTPTATVTRATPRHWLSIPMIWRLR